MSSFVTDPSWRDHSRHAAGMIAPTDAEGLLRDLTFVLDIHAQAKGERLCVVRF